MKENKKIREELERIYGKGCMFKKGQIEEKVEKRIIKSYKKFIEEKRYTGKFIKEYEGQMNLHHLKHRAEGGETSVENGAVVSALAHMYMHSLPREQEEIINNELRRYKEELEVEYVDDLETDVEVKCMVVQPEKMLGKTDKGKRYNRAKEKENLYNLTKDVIER